MKWKTDHLTIRKSAIYPNNEELKADPREIIFVYLKKST